MRIFRLLQESKAAFRFEVFGKAFIGLWGFFDVFPSEIKVPHDFISKLAEEMKRQPWPSLEEVEERDELAKRIWSKVFQQINAVAKAEERIKKEWHVKAEIIGIVEAVGKSLILCEESTELIKAVRKLAKKIPDLSKEVEILMDQTIQERGIPSAPLAFDDPAWMRSLIDFTFSDITNKAFESYIPRSLDLQRSLQPILLPRGQLDDFDQYFEDLKDPELREKAKAILSLPPEEINMNVRAIYEQMLIDIISRIAADARIPINIIRIYRVPSSRDQKILQQNGRWILSIGLDEIQKRFKLSAEERRRIFVGERRIEPAVERLNGRSFVIRSSGYIRRAPLITLETLELKDEEKDVLDVINIAIHPIFNHLKAFQPDNLKKLRHLRNILKNPREERGVLALRNTLITIQKPMKFSLDKLAKIAGYGATKSRHKRRAHEAVKRYLEYLEKIGDIEFHIEKGLVKIVSLVSYKSPRKLVD